MKDIYDKIIVLTHKVELMCREFSSFKNEVKDELATLNAGVRNDTMSLAKAIALLKKALLRDNSMGEDK